MPTLYWGPWLAKIRRGGPEYCKHVLLVILGFANTNAQKKYFGCIVFQSFLHLKVLIIAITKQSETHFNYYLHSTY